jgi:hypothetical protein
MKTCYVALPLGKKLDPGGRLLDFDHLIESRFAWNDPGPGIQAAVKAFLASGV